MRGRPPIGVRPVINDTARALGKIHDLALDPRVTWSPEFRVSIAERLRMLARQIALTAEAVNSPTTDDGDES